MPAPNPAPIRSPLQLDAYGVITSPEWLAYFQRIVTPALKSANDLSEQIASIDEPPGRDIEPDVLDLMSGNVAGNEDPPADLYGPVIDELRQQLAAIDVSGRDWEREIDELRQQLAAIDVSGRDWEREMDELRQQLAAIDVSGRDYQQRLDDLEADSVYDDMPRDTSGTGGGISAPGAWTSFTATFTGGTTPAAMTVTTATQECTYQQFGKTVSIRIYMTGVTSAANANTIVITGLPIATVDAIPQALAGCFADPGGATPLWGLAAYVQNSTITIQKVDGSTFNLGTSLQLIITGVYEGA